MKRLLREPLLHFLILGALLFGLHGFLNQDEEFAAGHIVVTAGRIKNLAATFAKVWQRPPSPAELQGLIDEYVKEEVLNREAIALGLDRDDSVIRRRLEQKMEFLAEDVAAVTEPTEEELAGYLTDHPEEFRDEARFTFRHVYLNPGKRGERLDSDAAELLAQLKQSGSQAEITSLGDKPLLPREFTKETRSAVAAQFGQHFAEALDGLTPGEWSGPIGSGYGEHLVLLSRRIESHMPELDEVRSKVKRRLTYARKEEANRRILEQLLEKYEVTVEWPEDDSTSPSGEQATAMAR